MSFRNLVAVVTLMVLGVPTRLDAQHPLFVGSELDAYLRLLEVTGRLQGAPLVFRPISPRHVGATLRADSAHPWSKRLQLSRGTRTAPNVRVTALAPVVHGVYQSAYPRSVNDGALWAGKGASGELQGGGTAEWGPLTLTVRPTVYAAANAEFPTALATYPDRPPLAYPWTDNIDWPQRPGTAATTQFDWGQSGIRLDLAGFTAGITTENMWWGPAAANPILMSNTAPGFPHLDLGTGRPVATPLGRFETRFVWGQLRESPYFDSDPSNDRRVLVGLTAALEPKWLPGLTLGAGRLFYMAWDSMDVADLFIVFQTVFKKAFQKPDNPAGDDDRDQMLSLFGRWVFPESGAEFYGEWSRNDHNADLRDFVLEPDHSQAFMLGFAKAFGSGLELWRLRAEMTHLERSPTFQVRSSPPYYVHHVVRQGYTHRGQLIGAGIGPGGSTQLMSLDRFSPDGRIGIYLQRTRYDNDAYYGSFGATESYLGHDVEITAGIGVLRFAARFDIGGTLTLSRELNRYFEVGRDVTNARLETSLRWRP